MKAAREVRCRRLPVRWRRSCCAGERPLCCSPAASPSTSARCGGARAVSGQWPPRGRPAGQRRRGRRIGADVPTLTGPAFVLTSGAQVAPTCGAVAGGPRSASGARASAAVGAMSFLVLRSRSSRCRRLGAERPPRRCDRPQRPRNPPSSTSLSERRSPCLEADADPEPALPRATPTPASPGAALPRATPTPSSTAATRSASSTSWMQWPSNRSSASSSRTSAADSSAANASPPRCSAEPSRDFVGGNPAPDNPLLVFVRKDRPSTDPHDSQAKEANRSKNQPPLFPPDPLQKSEKNLKDNPKWRIN